MADKRGTRYVDQKGTVASYRPRASLLLFARVLGEKFAGTTPIAKHFVADESSSGSK